MNIYVFGNPDFSNDNIAVKTAKQLIDNHSLKRQNINFIFQDPNEDFVPDEKGIIIMDAAKGIKKVRLLKDLDKIRLHKSTTMHDFDVTFQLKLLRKINRIRSVKIIAIPADLNLREAVRQVTKVVSLLAN